MRHKHGSPIHRAYSIRALANGCESDPGQARSSALGGLAAVGPALKRRSSNPAESRVNAATAFARQSCFDFLGKAGRVRLPDGSGFVAKMDESHDFKLKVRNSTRCHADFISN